jgi:hypothetical membrane protein
MEKIDILYKRLKGSYFIFLGICLSILFNTIAIILYRQVDPTFTMFSNFFSDLGDGPNNSNIVFNAGMIISGLFGIFIFLYLMRFLQEKKGNSRIILSAFIMGFIASIGTIMVGIFTVKTAPIMHVIGAAFSFFGNFFALILFAKTEFSISEISKKYSISGFILASFNFIYLIFFFLLYLNIGISKELTIVTEWLAIFANIIWLFLQGVFTLKEK